MTSEAGKRDARTCRWLRGWRLLCLIGWIVLCVAVFVAPVEQGGMGMAIKMLVIVQVLPATLAIAVVLAYLPLVVYWLCMLARRRWKTTPGSTE